MSKQKQPQQKSLLPQLNILPKIINGGIASIVGICIVFPLDLVKTRLQNQTIGPNGEKQYKNMLDCFKQTYRAEGYFGMYRGSGVNILLVTPEKAIKLAANDVFRYYLANPDGTISLLNQTISGAGAGLYQALITTPMELLKIQLQDAGRIEAQIKAAGGTIPPRPTAWGLTKKLYSQGGFFGFYRGIRATAIRDVGFSAIYFPMFAILSKWGQKPDEITPPFWWSFISGYVAGSTSAVAVTPADVIKTRMQTIPKALANGNIRGLWIALRPRSGTRA
ncbi:unnamed protein product [Spodoptera littoralis]|uniref:Uncharacterized protein n=1 Tax=Spodoptera littoralis TaxID=7109 RepID=A0A9P0HYD2_SPOLI|nr:unnamed protein product [Spodoptera littoralis]CAH1636072.1 unnamed protein product [Spodoptera littoralis]